MPVKSKKTKLIFLIYWFLLAYIMAALVFWFIELNRQNEKMSLYKLELLQNDNSTSAQHQRFTLQKEKKRKVYQYAGEGSIFFLVIVAGAVFIYWLVKKQLQQSQQQQNFMVAVTHELKTPVAVAKLNLETIQKRKLEESQQQRLMQNTLQEINRLDALCNNMLLSSQIEAGGYNMIKEEINLSELCNSMINEIRNRHLDRTINCTLEDIVYVMADKVLLQIVMNNLLENALKYTPKVTPVDLVMHTENKMAILTILDKGTGIPMEERKKIFQKFYRLGNEATRHSKGTGLGLYLTKRIITAHQGSIDIHDNPGGGSIFTVYFPLA